MKKALFTVIAITVFLSSGVFAVNGWGPAVKQAAKSVLTVEGPAGSCTGFPIDSKKHYVLTAAHCDFSGPGLTPLIDKLPGRVVFKDAKKDLLVYEVERLDKPALKIALKDPEIGDEVASFGYGHALNEPLFRITHISAAGVMIPFDGIGGPFIFTDTDFVGGQSGGPVIDQTGAVVMIVQMGTQGVGIGVGAEIIRKAVDDFIEEPK